MTIVDKSTF